jgi:steroid 5-alpha reductase family enzyme
MTDDDAATTTNHHGRTGQRHGIAVGEGQIRRIFPVFVLAMWVATGIAISTGRWTGLSWLLAAEAAAICLVVFVNFVWVFNFGYAACAVVLNVTILAVAGASTSALLVGGLLTAYGLRLAIFSLRRYRHPSFAARAAGVRAAHRTLPLPIKVLLWLQTTTLFTFHATTTFNLATTDAPVSAWVVVGAALLAVGLVLEAVADHQKQSAKADVPDRWVSTGLFARMRHPNYLGEIVVQLGVVVAGVGAAGSVGWWVAAALAPVYIMILMLSATTGAELAAEARYGDVPGFDDYVGRTGILLPRR